MSRLKIIIKVGCTKSTTNIPKMLFFFFLQSEKSPSESSQLCRGKSVSFLDVDIGDDNLNPTSQKSPTPSDHSLIPPNRMVPNVAQQVPNNSNSNSTSNFNFNGNHFFLKCNYLFFFSFHSHKFKNCIWQFTFTKNMFNVPHNSPLALGWLCSIFWWTCQLDIRINVFV